MIQWFPGHMAKAQREVEQYLKLVDLVIELADARVPYSSRNPVIKNMIQDKPSILLLMKNDLADDNRTNEWLNKFKKKDIKTVCVNANNQNDIQHVIQAVREVGKERLESLRKRGVESKVIRAMIVGIPNVGKSTLINRLANRKVTRIGARPGITKRQQWIKIRSELELLDTPGILWPKFDDEIIGKRLAAIGTIKDDLIPEQDIAAFILQHLMAYYEGRIEKRYQVEETEDMWELFTQIGKRRGALESGGRVNFDKVSEIVINDFRDGKLGNVTLE